MHPGALSSFQGPNGIMTLFVFDQLFPDLILGSSLCNLQRPLKNVYSRSPCGRGAEGCLQSSASTLQTQPTNCEFYFFFIFNSR